MCALKGYFNNPQIVTKKMISTITKAVITMEVDDSGMEMFQKGSQDDKEV